MKSYPYGNASREKTVKAARLKIFEVIDKSLSELLKKTANQKKVWFLSYIDSKKRIFRRRRANGVAPTILPWKYILLSIWRCDVSFASSRTLVTVFRWNKLSPVSTGWNCFSDGSWRPGLVAVCLPLLQPHPGGNCRPAGSPSAQVPPTSDTVDIGCCQLFTSSLYYHDLYGMHGMYKCMANYLFWFWRALGLRFVPVRQFQNRNNPS